jgi:hypothetical protein
MPLIEEAVYVSSTGGQVDSGDACLRAIFDSLHDYKAAGLLQERQR